MNPGDPAPPYREQAPDHHKNDEAEVEDKDQVSKDLPKHEGVPNSGGFPVGARIHMGSRGRTKTTLLFPSGL
jgi:hypothetical protein